MHVIVLGAGVIGVTGAYYLARAGHMVTVIDRQASVAGESSHANAGMIAPGHAYAWASPRAPLVLLKSLLGGDTALKFRLRPDPRLWLWSLRFLGQCTAERSRANTLAKLTLCLYSREALNALVAETGIAYDRVAKGALYIYRDPDHLRLGVRNMALLNDFGAGLEAVDAERCAAIEPALAGAKGRLAGAIFAPKDESGDCRVFTEALAQLCGTMGVAFRLGETARGLRTEGDRVTGVITDKGTLSGDLYVMSLASESPLLARQLGLRLPIYPVKGYALTLPAREGAPTVPGVDEGRLVAFARMGGRLRLTATAEFAGYGTGYRERDFATMLRMARDWFPHGADYDRREHWACLRPMTPDGPPIVGRGPHRNLYYNTGHGHMGWTMACGSGRILADLVAEKAPDIDASGLRVDRY